MLVNYSLVSGWTRLRLPPLYNNKDKRNRPSKLGGASIRKGAYIGDNTVLAIWPPMNSDHNLKCSAQLCNHHANVKCFSYMIMNEM